MMFGLLSTLLVYKSEESDSSVRVRPSQCEVKIIIIRTIYYVQVYVFWVMMPSSGNVRLFHHVLTSSFFCFNGQFYKQTSGVMGLSLSAVIAIYLEEVELSWQPTSFLVISIM